ncbi:hypothetical protein [Niallia sp. 03190]|uniref:hypothetical protein n=1 Tax=Niallia sp. 03190 TaxID=3458061 RepID=UPI00404486FD
MIPTFLQDEIKTRLEKLFEGELFNNPKDKGNKTTLKIYEQHLPRTKASKDDGPSLYPCVLVQLSQGTNKKVFINLVIVVFDENLDRQGYKDLLHIIQKISQDFAEYPTMEKQYSLSDEEEIKWVIHEEDIHPYYLAGLELTFKPGLQIERKDVSHLI